MKLLFDQNISPKLLKILPENFDTSTQVRLESLENASDLEIFKFALKNNYSIVTFDSDFYDLSVFKGCPPKIIWLRTGNMTTKSISDILTLNFDNIILFLSENDQCVLEIHS